eukprot:CAMPEP_0172627400 /NCGR_PEP_ID=MMETSP1068-20121228/156011_1 /TAXON_ID=35684 /ORGANISM="Pseudopedinella elastica, Strain CCMP716" /LENGTH=212 /DNA_ID=CAMNT_0013437269 /DNA_START=37 /DNA_END=672 /DNA_ORIENTATION=+
MAYQRSFSGSSVASNSSAEPIRNFPNSDSEEEPYEGMHQGMLSDEELSALEEAETSIRLAIKREPSAQAFNNLGNVLQAKGELDEAEDAYRKAIDLDPDYASAHTNLGVALHNKGDLTGAEDATRRAIDLDPSNPHAHGTLAAVLNDRVAILEEAVEGHDDELAAVHAEYAAKASAATKNLSPDAYATKMAALEASVTDLEAQLELERKAKE